MTEADAYMIGFRRRCIDEGLTPEQTQARIKVAAEKHGFSVSSLAGPASLAALAVAGGTAGLGYGAGRLLGGMQSDQLGAEEARAKDLVNMYRLLALKARQQKQLQQGVLSDPRDEAFAFK